MFPGVGGGGEKTLHHRRCFPLRLLGIKTSKAKEPFRFDFKMDMNALLKALARNAEVAI